MFNKNISIKHISVRSNIKININKQISNEKKHIKIIMYLQGIFR